MKKTDIIKLLLLDKVVRLEFLVIDGGLVIARRITDVRQKGRDLILTLNEPLDASVLPAPILRSFVIAPSYTRLQVPLDRVTYSDEVVVLEGRNREAEIDIIPNIELKPATTESD